MDIGISVATPVALIILIAWVKLLRSGRDANRIDRQGAALWLLAMGGVAAFTGVSALAYGPWVILAGAVAINGLAVQAVSLLFGYSWCAGIEVQG